MSLDEQYGVIGMTTRHDRVDNFWFVLLHELGHLVRHWPRVLYGAILDENAGEPSGETLEDEADEFAENAIIPRTTWQSSLVRFTKSADAIKEYAARHQIHPALVAGRTWRWSAADHHFTLVMDQLAQAFGLSREAVPIESTTEQLELI